jgi:hypothetical protein
MEPSSPAYPGYNPYALPGGPTGPAGGQEVTPAILGALRGTRPWVLLFSILGFLGSGLLVLFALFLVFGVSFLKSFHGGGFAGIGLGILYLLLSCLYIAPSLFLLRYAKSIASLTLSRNMGDLEQALTHQRSFWRFVGILTSIMLCIYAFALIIALIFGAGAFLMRR